MVPWYDDLGDFPPSVLALGPEDDADGLLCASQSINLPLLKQSYPRGIYPWYSPGDPVLWWTPSQRAVLWCNAFKISRSLAKTLRSHHASGRYQVRIDQSFDAVLAACANRPQGTWMNAELQAAYTDWHQEGAVHSIELWRSGQLVGGFYGVALGQMFFGESMFSQETDASKVALACFVRWFSTQGGDLIDCQQASAHLLSLGASTLPRETFETNIAQRIQAEPIDWRSATKLDLLQSSIESRL